MTSKLTQKEISAQQLKEELKAIKAARSSEHDLRLVELARNFAINKQMDQALEAMQLVTDEKERNLLIADLIEVYLLPAHDISLAKKFAKYLTPVPETLSLVSLRIALADNDTEDAQKIAQKLPSPLSRNYAYLHIMESFLANKEKKKVSDLLKLMIENVKTIYEFKTRCYVLRELAINLFLANNEKEQAKEIAMLIPDETIRNQVLNKIGTAK